MESTGLSFTAFMIQDGFFDAQSVGIASKNSSENFKIVRFQIDNEVDRKFLLHLLEICAWNWEDK